MNELDFHIDETVMHSATIDQKKDFGKLMAEFEATQQTPASLSGYWIATSLVVGLAILSLSAFNGTNLTTDSPMAHQTTLSSKEVVTETSLLASVPEKDLIKLEEVVLNDAIIESVVTAKMEETKADQVVNSPTPKEPILGPNIATKRRSIAETMIKHPVAIETAKPASIPVSSIKIPSGIELNVDLITYAELKKNKHYFFEIDTLKSEVGEELFDMDWDEADLKRHPDKDRYKMILKKNGQKREIIVRLVKNSLQFHSERKWRLFARK